MKAKKKKYIPGKTTKKGRPRQRAEQAERVTSADKNMRGQANIKQLKKEALKEDPMSIMKQLDTAGRDRLLSSPKEILKAMEGYVKYNEANPYYKSEWKDGRIVKLPVRRPLSMMGLCMYIGTHDQYLYEYEKSLKGHPLEKDFSLVINYIRRHIYRDKLDGASSGFFNANIISRDLGLVDKQDIDMSVNRKSVAELFPPLDENDKN